MAAASYQLEHFYYGQFVRDGQPYEAPRLLARSRGVTQEQAEALVSQISLLPSPDVSDLAWAVVRGRTSTFVMVQAQRGRAGQLMLHYVLLPSDVLRALGGNLDVLQALVEESMPAYDRLGDDLPRLNVPQAGAASTEAQIDHMLELLTCANNRMDVIEAMLASVVQGIQLAVINAPPVLAERAMLVKGLLALLPPPARFGVTFTTYRPSATQLDAQICFYEGVPPPSDTLIFDWAAAGISGQVLEDGYSHFTISQLRLDPQLVIEETQALTAVAAWRIRQGDALAVALAYASQRLVMDRALENNLPVELDEVAAILASDPTLSPELRRIYTDHLMSVALALEDMQFADAVSLLLRQDADLARQVHRQLQDAIQAGQSGLVYSTLARWLGNPLGPQGAEWLQLAHRAALAQADKLTRAGDTAALNTFMATMSTLEPTVEVERIVPRLVEQALPLSLKDKQLARTLFELAVRYLDGSVILRLLGAARYLAQLPAVMSEASPYILAAVEQPAPAKLLLRASIALGADMQPLLLIRLAEAALSTGQVGLLEQSTLPALVKAAQHPGANAYSEVFRAIVNTLSHEDVLPTLDEKAPIQLWQMLLLLGEYRQLAAHMLYLSRNFYTGDQQVVYAEYVNRLFAVTSQPVAAAFDALDVLEAEGVRSLPLAMARIGVVQANTEAPECVALVAQTLAMLEADPVILEVIPARPLYDLLRFYMQREDVAAVQRLMHLIPTAAVNQGNAGIVLMIRMVKMMGDDAFKVSAWDTLREYVRQCDPETAHKAIIQFGRELGLPVREALEATYTVKRMMVGVSFADYAHLLHLVADLLEDTVVAYADKGALPTLGALVNATQSLSGGLMDDESNAIAESVIGMGRAIVVLGEHQQARAPRNLDRHIEDLLAGSSAPRCGLDTLWMMGGFFSKGRRYRIQLRRSGTAYPLGERSALALHEETDIANQLLRSVIQAFPPDKPVQVTAEALRGEIESLWRQVSEVMQQELVRNLAIDCQRIAQLISYITENGDARVVQAGGMNKLEEGKQQPRNTLEFYRYLYGYFKTS